MLSRLSSSYRWLQGHPEFQAKPARILFRLLMWETYKITHQQPIINIHACSKMQLHPGKRRGIHGLVYIFRNAYEPIVSKMIDRSIHSGMICYDIGANIGLWTLRISEKVAESGKVYAIEPFSKNLEHLRENIRLSNCQNVEVIPVGLGATQGRATLYVPADPGRSSLSAESEEDFQETIEIQKLDDLWQNQGYPHIGFVKIDAEGAEPLILQGGAKFFKQVQPVICCEIHPAKLKSMGYHPKDIIEPFCAWGYESYYWNSESQTLDQYEYDSSNPNPVDVVFSVNKN